MDISGLLRIESGENTPTRETARRIFKFYRGAVPLGVIFDPMHSSSFAWLKENAYGAEIATAAALLLRDRPELGQRIRKRRVDKRRRGQAGQLA